MQIKNGIMTFVFLSVLSISNLANAENAPWQCMGPAESCILTKKAHKTFYRRSNATAKDRSNSAADNSSTASYERSQYSTEGRSNGSNGMASYYWQPQRLASGGVFNPYALTAAHKTLPFGTRVLVTNKNNGRSVTVTINDRGPFVRGRIIDLSKAAASEIGMIGSGVAPVSVAIMD